MTYFEGGFVCVARGTIRMRIHHVTKDNDFKMGGRIIRVLFFAKMQRWEGRNALVTGASSGIGAAVAELLVEHGMNVIGLARRVERIEVSSHL